MEIGGPLRDGEGPVLPVVDGEHAQSRVHEIIRALGGVRDVEDRHELK